MRTTDGVLGKIRGVDESDATRWSRPAQASRCLVYQERRPSSCRGEARSSRAYGPFHDGRVARAWAHGADAETFLAEHAVFLEAMGDDELLDRPCGGRTASSVLVFGIAITLPCGAVSPKATTLAHELSRCSDHVRRRAAHCRCPESLSGSLRAERPVVPEL